MRAVGFLAGVGSLLWEAKDAGFDVVGNFETRAPYRTARQLSWDLNFPHADFITDVDQFTPFEGYWWNADLAIGHPPCGSHSLLGGMSSDRSVKEREENRRKRHKDSGLLPMYTQLVRLLKPKSFVLDNLPKIMTTVAPKEWWTNELPDYRLTFIIMFNWDYGTPQLRKRLWVVGVRRPIKRFEFSPLRQRPKGAPTTVLEALAGLPWEPWENDERLGHVHVQPQDRLHGHFPVKGGREASDTADVALGYLALPTDHPWPYITKTGRPAVKISWQRLDPFKRSRTLTGLPSLYHPLTGWPLTPRERARLMDWPDQFKLGDVSTTFDTYALRRLTLFTGKAVPSAFPRYLLPQLVKHLRRHG